MADKKAAELLGRGVMVAAEMVKPQKQAAEEADEAAPKMM